jgi:hypothetical protein
MAIRKPPQIRRPKVIPEKMIPETPCVGCWAKEYGCGCEKEERFLRNVMAGNYTAPFSPELREALIHQADQDGEGSVDLKQLVNASDQEVAHTSFWAMVEYARSQMG